VKTKAGKGAPVVLAGPRQPTSPPTALAAVVPKAAVAAATTTSAARNPSSVPPPTSRSSGAEWQRKTTTEMVATMRTTMGGTMGSFCCHCCPNIVVVIGMMATAVWMQRMAAAATAAVVAARWPRVPITRWTRSITAGSRIVLDPGALARWWNTLSHGRNPTPWYLVQHWGVQGQQYNKDNNKQSYAYFDNVGKTLRHPTGRPAVLDLYAGASGMSLGLEKHFNLRWVINNDHLAAATLRANKAGSKVCIYVEDVKAFLMHSV
jgi:hypothetical protein